MTACLSWRVVVLVGLDRREAIRLGFLGSAAFEPSVAFTAGAGGAAGAASRHRAGRDEAVDAERKRIRRCRGQKQVGGRERRAVRGAAGDQDAAVVRQQDGAVSAARRRQPVARRLERLRPRVVELRGIEVRAAVAATSHQHSAVDEHRRRSADPRMPHPVVPGPGAAGFVRSRARPCSARRRRR